MAKGKISAIVFIKKESERLPGKNLRLFNGRPLFTVILQTLNNHPLIDNILVDSDSEEVLSYVKSAVNKGIAIDRPAHLRNQTIGANELIGYDLQFSENEHFFQTHCTNPLLTPQTITKAIEKYFELLPQNDSVFSVTRIQNRFFKEDGKPLNHERSKLHRLQDLPPVYMENAGFFIFSKTSFANSGNDRIGTNPFLYTVSTIECVDIDFEQDFLLAEMLERNKASFPVIFGDLI